MIEEEFPHVKKKMKKNEKNGGQIRGGVGEGAHLPPSGKGGAPPFRMPAGYEGSFAKVVFLCPGSGQGFSLFPHDLTS